MNRFIDPQKLLDANAGAAEQYQADRRTFVKRGLLFTAALGFWTPALAEAGEVAPRRGREISLTNAHTGEKFSGEYWYDGKYSPDAFHGIKSLMRDYRTGEKFPIDPRLMDVLFVLRHRLANKGPFEVYSGYRSPTTNAWLRRFSHGVARQSLHMQGQAVDICLPGTRLSTLHNAALGLRAGGVGYYPSSDFVHVDTGRVRSW
jgi:uncharacterized protein YcbK (DUF882 family)